MKKKYYQPANNYERNLLMTKQFCGKFSVLLLPVFMFILILCSCYLTLTSKEPLELYLFKVVFSKFGCQFEFGGFENVLFVGKLLMDTFFIFAFFYIFFTSRNSDNESTPDFGISLLHKYSQLELVLFVLSFITLAVTTITFIFSDASHFETIGEKLGLSLSDLKAYKLTIVFVLIALDAAAFFSIWYAQSQTNFLKSLRLCLYDSLPRNKGAHTYGVFSLALGVFQIGFAGLCTFMYYCYRDAFAGFGISLDSTYVFVSLTNSYVAGLIPFTIGINAFMFSSMVDEINTYGTLYNDYAMMGTTESYR